MTLFFPAWINPKTSELKKIIFLNGILILAKLLLKTMLFLKKKPKLHTKGREREESAADEMQMRLFSDSWLRGDDMCDEWLLKHEQASSSDSVSAWQSQQHYWMLPLINATLPHESGHCR